MKIRTFKTTQYDRSNASLEQTNCFAEQINLEECIIQKNRFDPCPPISRDIYKLQKLDNEWKKGLAHILRSEQFGVVEQTSREGNLLLQIEPCNEKYRWITFNYSKTLPDYKLPELYDSVKLHYDSLLSEFKVDDIVFGTMNSFTEKVKNAIYKKEILDIDGIMNDIITVENNLKMIRKNLDQKFDNFNKAFRKFLSLFPKKIQEKCTNGQEYQHFIEKKIDLIEHLRIHREDFVRKIGNKKLSLSLEFYCY